MRTTALCFIALLGLSTTAKADTFQCDGTGRFFKIGTQSFDAEQTSSKDLYDDENLNVRVELESLSSDQAPYLVLIVTEKTEGEMLVHGTRGSSNDVVEYVEFDTRSASRAYSSLKCTRLM